MVTKEEGGGGINCKYWINIDTLLYIKYVNHRTCGIVQGTIFNTV